MALGYMQEHGYEFLDRNVRIGAKEIDLVMQLEEMVVFIEVKTRTTTSFGSPEESLTPAKQRHLIQAAWGYLERVDRLDWAWRFDVIAIEATADRKLIRIDHYPAAFEVGLL